MDVSLGKNLIALLIFQLELIVWFRIWWRFVVTFYSCCFILCLIDDYIRENKSIPKANMSLGKYTFSIFLWLFLAEYNGEIQCAYKFCLCR